MEVSWRDTEAVAGARSKRRRRVDLRDYIAVLRTVAGDGAVGECLGSELLDKMHRHIESILQRRNDVQCIGSKADRDIGPVRSRYHGARDVEEHFADGCGPAVDRVGHRFMGGEPMKPATNALAGRS